MLHDVRCGNTYMVSLYILHSFGLTDNAKKGYGNNTCVHWVNKRNMMHGTKCIKSMK